ncbi:MAG: hypothetical protein ACRC5M_02540, partial [Anaeroplasmataceae bacterium]
DISTLNNIILLINNLHKDENISNDFRISINRYSESTYDSKWFISQVKYLISNLNILPSITMHTNGDYFNNNDMSMFYQTINNIIINRYDDAFEDAIMFIENNNFNIIKIDFSQNTIYCNKENSDIRIIYKKKEVMKIKNRGGELTSFNSIEKCVNCDIAKSMIAIDYNGNIMPCCELHSDIANHKCASHGNVNTIDSAELSIKIEEFNSLNYNCCLHCEAEYDRII